MGAQNSSSSATSQRLVIPGGLSNTPGINGLKTYETTPRMCPLIDFNGYSNKVPADDVMEICLTVCTKERLWVRDCAFIPFDSVMSSFSVDWPDLFTHPMTSTLANPKPFHDCYH
ncbi:hypothetical protein Moror_12507 [Moniliophthora roreri MCA 2997]|uniref:Uncharacterized protein n=1 Tax=Moniliophthora roreri (strain MCA 2997) TaxID=1381753 RepID=V2X967_MONRO|nr:hypothetical protein Moror_12507 [Moniliophthora roreri MCA 2997]